MHKNNVEFQIVIEIFCECPESLKFDKNDPDRKILITKNHLLIEKQKTCSHSFDFVLLLSRPSRRSKFQAACPAAATVTCSNTETAEYFLEEKQRFATLLVDEILSSLGDIVHVVLLRWHMDQKSRRVECYILLWF